MQRSLADLKRECAKLDLVVEVTGRREQKRDYVGALQNHFLALRPEISWGLSERLKIETPMLALNSGTLRPEEIHRIENSDRYVYEEKLKGVRMLTYYHPLSSFEFFSRSLSVRDYIPVSYTNKIPLAVVPKSISEPFVLDCEIISNNPNISTVLGKRGVVTETPQEAVSALLALNAEDSIRIQKELDYPLELHVFDCLMLNGESLIEKTYFARRKALNEVINKILGGLGLPFFKVKAVLKKKKEYLEHLWEQGSEGVIAKPLDFKYLIKPSRPRGGWIKFKETVSGSLGDTVDGFISGFEPGKPEKGFAHLVGCFLVSIFLTDKDGNDYEHLVAKTPNIELELREKISSIDDHGHVQMDPSYIDRVVEVEGQSVSSRARRLTHPRLVGFRDDKMKHDCVMKEEHLLALIR